jgi:hypothetical protein
MEYILILYFATTSMSGGMTLSAATFRDRPACEAAAFEAKKMAGFFAITKHVCITNASQPAAPISGQKP